MWCDTQHSKLRNYTKHVPGTRNSLRGALLQFSALEQCLSLMCRLWGEPKRSLNLMLRIIDGAAHVGASDKDAAHKRMAAANVRRPRVTHSHANVNACQAWKCSSTFACATHDFAIVLPMYRDSATIRSSCVQSATKLSGNQRLDRIGRENYEVVAQY